MGEWLGSTPTSRSQRAAINTEGVKFLGGGQDKIQKWRDPKLEELDAYYESRQYDNLQPWEQHEDSGGDYIPIRKRKPRIIYAFAKVLVDRISARLVGDNVFPKLKIEDDPDTDKFVGFVVKAANLRVHLLDVIKKMLYMSSGFIRFYIVDGVVMVETYKSKYCYPEFLPNGELESVRVQYLYEDPEEKDKKGNPKVKWYKLQLNQDKDVLFNNPEYERGKDPEFTVVSSVDHGLGFVQGQWFKTSGGNHNSPDGYALVADLFDFIDELNYSISQTSTAVQYNQDPVLTLKGMTEDEVKVIRSSTKALNLGREGEAKFLETAMQGVQTAIESRDKMKHLVQEIARVVFLDPEKMAANSQSGRAMEVMHGPLVELVNELRPQIETPIISLIMKLSITILYLHNQGQDVPISIPDGFQPKSLNITAHWPPIFPLTIEDLQKKVQMAVQVAGASLFSRETLTRWLAEDFHVEDIEEELQKVNDQPILNPFGGGFMDSGAGNKPPPKGK